MADIAPACGACTRHGCARRQPAMANGRCRIHGGKSTGPHSAQGLERLRKARTRRGAYSKEALEPRKMIRALEIGTKRLSELA